MDTLTYKDAGVDVPKGNRFVKGLASIVQETYNENVVAGVGGFAALYSLSSETYLAAATDGVGTKLQLALKHNLHQNIGQDLVAMCVNDLLCVGARPLFFLDYLATGKLDLITHTEVVKGIAAACKKCSIPLIGGETAEMPGMYKKEEYDLAGFAMGIVEKDHLLDGTAPKPGDTLIGLPSSGFHANGYGLLRKLVEENHELEKKLLTPTRLYTTLISDLQKSCGPKALSGIAHITGGGQSNIGRLAKNLAYKITSWPSLSEIPKVFSEVLHNSRYTVSEEELHKTFNMGIGMVLSTPRPEPLYEFFRSKNEQFWVIGNLA